MNVADIELCKELFKLSKWESELTWAATKQDNTVLVSSHEKELGHDLYRVAYAYDLSYLLRKLPEIRLETWHNGHIVIKHFTSNGVPEKLERLGKVVKAEADTPEDAACQLAIELHKQGILPTPQDYKET